MFTCLRMKRCKMAQRTIVLILFTLVLITLYWSYKFHVSSCYNCDKVLWEESIRIIAKTPTSSQDDESTLSHYYHHSQRSYLLQKLLQLEKRLNQRQRISRIIFKGPANMLKVEIPLYKSSLKQYGHKLLELSNVAEYTADETGRWSAMMCFTQHDYPCLSKETYTDLQLHQKVSYIPGLEKVLLHLDSFCYTMSASHHLSVFAMSPLSVPCYVLPSKSKRLSENLAQSVESGELFLIRTSHQGSSQCTFTMKRSTVRSMLQLDGLVQVIDHPVLINRVPLIVKVYVLVASMSPLRIYRHQDMKAVIMAEGKDVEESWSSFDKLGDYLSRSHTLSDVRNAWSLLDQLIVNTLILGEATVLSNMMDWENDLLRSNHIFQLLEFHVTLNTSLYPHLLQVKSTNDGSMRTGHNVAADTMHLMFSAASTADQVNEMFAKLRKHFGVEGFDCDEEKVCLTERELVYIMESYREANSLARFKKLYPVSDGHKYRALLDELLAVDTKTSTKRGTPQLHGILTLIERYMQRGTGDDNSGQRGTVTERKRYWETEDEDDSGKIFSDGSNKNHDARNRPKCDDVPSTAIPVLDSISMEPSSPQFNFTSEITEYEVRFPFDVMVVRFWGKTSTCKAVVRVNSRDVTALPSNFSLGVGWNKLVIHLVDEITHPVIATYNVYIYRRRRSEGEPFFNINLPYEMCAVRQDCNLMTFPGQPCGPQRTPGKTMKELLYKIEDLPLCDSGAVPGSWVLPCVKCGVPDSCYWSEVVWSPESCRHRTLTEGEAKACLAGKKILFVGDSTNRGIMYYLMEKINGSLRQWEKTHSMKVYSSALNDGRTSVSFGYYPQFWLPPERKPDFLKSLQHLMARFMPLENNTNTVLVVGGVQWLLPSHVMVIKTTLMSLGLNGIKVIIKGLGSGFHLPVPDFVKLTAEGQRRIAVRNQNVMQAANTAGFEVVDTFAMTVARYKEFLMGKCGCHFHKVVDLRASQRKDYDELISPSRLAADDNLPLYHVNGPINAAYSEIMIGRMCS